MTVEILYSRVGAKILQVSINQIEDLALSELGY